MLHGLLVGNMSTWYWTAAPVLARTHRVILFDLRGHGRSGRPLGGYDGERMTRDLASVIDRVTDGPVALVGHSYGGYIALRFAVRHPERVCKIAAVEAPLPPSSLVEMRAFMSQTPAEILASLPAVLRGAITGGRRGARMVEGIRFLAQESSLVRDLEHTEDLPDDALRAEMLAAINEPKPVAPVEPAPHASTLIRPWLGMERGAGGRTRVTFVWEPAPRVPGDRVRHVPSHLVLKALAPDGQVLFEGPVAPTGAGAVDEPGATAARVVFETPPGRLRLRMSIQDAAEQPIDQDVREISIRDLRNGVVVGTPEVLRARTAKEFRALEAATAVPVSAREFSRTERLLIRFRASGSAGEAPAVSARLLSRMGQAMRDLPVTTDGAATHLIDLPLAGFAAGDYIIEVTAKSATGEASERLNFRVTS